ncbi:hypothetical protein BURCENBC7_AP4397 [Burkholderia cenocepacia BC7]|nr:uncharacterized protein BCN122_II3241 [Burkholderia cenocepacia]EPZ88185.1 hypothetical protein BURCENK562V_C5040 [Burkholderia cenocepacia K56-2Valvano]ERI28334.1 hypothetical protein BURCENBC7_AP4397 [Burkholderia cenocepacia BC7]CDN64517.1 hypothetical protein I35_6681 [Burkholderia cenocepacia H111]
MGGAQPGFCCRHRQSCGDGIPAQSRQNFDNWLMTFLAITISIPISI